MEYTVYFIPGLIYVIEIALIALLISLIGAAIYVFFISSMKNDRNEQRIKIYANRVSSEYGFGDGSSPNPWDTITCKGADDKPQKKSNPKNVKIGIALLIAAIIVLIVLIALITSIR